MRRTTYDWEVKYFARPKVCESCGKVFYFVRARGRYPKYCSNACKQRAYRLVRKELPPCSNRGVT